jgi:hypothetical protein
MGTYNTAAKQVVKLRRDPKGMSTHKSFIQIMFIIVVIPTVFLREPVQQILYSDSLWAGRSGV